MARTALSVSRSLGADFVGAEDRLSSLKPPPAAGLVDIDTASGLDDSVRPGSGFGTAVPEVEVGITDPVPESVAERARCQIRLQVRWARRRGGLRPGRFLGSWSFDSYLAVGQLEIGWDRHIRPCQGRRISPRPLACLKRVEDFSRRVVSIMLPPWVTRPAYAGHPVRTAIT